MGWGNTLGWMDSVSLISCGISKFKLFFKPQIFISISLYSLMWACWKGFTEVVQTLIDQGANVNQASKVCFH